MKEYGRFKAGDYVEGVEEIHYPLDKESTFKTMRGWIDDINVDFGKVYIRADDCYNGARGTSLRLESLRKVERVENWWNVY